MFAAKSLAFPHLITVISTSVKAAMSKAQIGQQLTTDAGFKQGYGHGGGGG